MKNKNIIISRFLPVFFALLFLFSLSGLTFLSAVPAQAAYDPTGRGVGYTPVLYNNSNGLPTSDANAIAQTREGFIWIGCYNGLIRYDGSSFHRYEASTGISSVVSLFTDSKDRLWIGTNENGVFMLEKGKFTHYRQDDVLHSASIRAITEDDKGNILIASTLGMAYIDPEGGFHALSHPSINREYICELAKGVDGTIYGLTNAGSFFTIRDLQLTEFYDYESLGLDAIYTIYPDPSDSDRIYLGMQNGTVLYGSLSDRLADYKTYSVAPQQTVACIRQVEESIWICADNGIGYLLGDTYVPLSDLPMNNSVENIFVDYEQNLWFTSSRQGLLKIVNNNFTDISLAAGLPPLVVNAAWFKDGLLYIGTDSGLKILNEAYEQVGSAFAEMLDGIRIRSIREDSNGLLWFGTNSDYALLWLDPATGNWGSYNTDNGLATNRARVCLELSDGRMAVATNAGVNIIENGAVTALYNDKQGLRNLEILCLEEGEDGTILAGSDGDGLYLIKGEEATRISEEDGLSSNVILRICRDPFEAGLFWVVTSSGINYIRNGEAVAVQSFPYPNNFEITFDKAGHMWVISSNGIYTVKREEMLAGEHISYTLFDIDSGLPSGPTANSYSCMSEDQILYIACAEGVSSINVSRKSIDGNIRLSVPFIEVDDEEVYIEGGSVTIPSTCKRLTINAYAFSYSLNNPRLSCQLVGFDDHPIEMFQSELMPLVYTNLAGQAYTFRFALIDTLADNESQVLTLKLTKEKKITEQFWFWPVIGLAFIGLILAIIITYFRRKTKRMEEQQKEKERLIDEMTNVFAKCVDMKDTYTNGHSQRVADYAVMLAKRMGKSEEEQNRIHRIAQLHDIGKIAIPDSILNKPDRLNDEEFALMKTHSRRGAEILSEVSLEPDLAIGAGYHHERIDGRGYPQGLKGDEIPEIAQIIAVADTFDAMYSTRPYRKQVRIADVAAEIRRISGTQLNAEIAGILLEMIDEGLFNDLIVE